MRHDRIKNLIAVALFIFLSGSAVYIGISNSGADTNLTEFYMLNSEGKASDYPQNMSTGETSTLIIGIVNHKSQEQKYVIKGSWGNDELTISEIEVGSHNERKMIVNFTAPKTPGLHQYHISLYRNSQTGRSFVGVLRLSVSVRTS